MRQADKLNVKILSDIFHERGPMAMFWKRLNCGWRISTSSTLPIRPSAARPAHSSYKCFSVYSKLLRLSYNDWIAMEFYPEGDPGPPLDMARRRAIQAMSR